MRASSSVPDRGSITAPKRERYFEVVVLLVTGLAYARVLGFDFASDDQVLILNNPFVKSWHDVARYFVTPYWRSHAIASPHYYRPLFMLFLRLNYFIFQDRPAGWHLVALLLHLAVTWLVYVLIRRITGQFTLAWLSALIFGVHPMHHEAVAWITGATESLVAATFIIAFLAFLEYRETSRKRWLVTSCVAYTVAVLFKETAVVFPALVFAHSLIEEGAKESGLARNVIACFKRAAGPALAYLPITLIYLLVRHWVFAGVLEARMDEPITAWFLTLPSLLLFYVRNWIAPVGLSELYDVYIQARWSLAGVLLPSLILLCLAGLVYMYHRRFGDKTITHAIVWIVIPLAPSLDTFVFGPDQLVHDRYFQLSSIGAALLVAFVIQHLAATRGTVLGEPVHVVAAGLVLAVVLSLLSVNAASFWQNNYTLFERAYEIAPLNNTAADNFAAELVGHGKLEAAEAILERGYERHKDFGIAFNLGRVEYMKGRYAAAEAYTRECIALAPYFADAYVSLGQIELRQVRPIEAQASMRRAVEITPDDERFHTSYGTVLAFNGDCAAANEQFQAALRLNPADASAEAQLGRCRGGEVPGNAPRSERQ